MIVRVFFIILICVTLLPATYSATKENQQQANTVVRTRQQTEIKYRSSEIIVKYKNNADLKAINQSHLSIGGQVQQEFSHFRNLKIIKNQNDVAINEVLEHYRSNPAVEYAEPNYVFQIQIEPNDARYPQMWGLNNIGQTGGTSDADINAPEAWDLTTGSADVVVASIDTGVDYTHPDLSDNMWINPGEIPGNNIDDDNNGYIDDIHGINAINDSGDPMDDHGHGTHTAGTMAARGNNSIGVTGVSWNSKIVACKFLSASGGGFTSDAIECLDYLLDLKTRAENPVNIVVSNNSWGGGGFSQALRDAIEAHQNADILFVASAGNASSNNDDRASYPAAYDLSGIVAVAATDHNDDLAFFSNFGRFSVDVGAPGLDILSTFPMGECSLCEDNSGYGTISGTSMAAPHVAGLVALLKAQDPDRNSFAIKNVIMSGGQVVSGTDGVVLSSRRIRAADGDGVGSLTCDNRELREFLIPPTIVATAGTQIPLYALQINCENPLSDPISVTALPENQDLALLDDGVGADQVAGDGLASALFTANVTGSLQLPDSQSIPVNIVENYGHPLITSAAYRQLDSGTEQTLDLQLDSFSTITSPFPIRFGGENNTFTTVYALSHGVIAFDEPTIIFFNSSLPLAGANTWIAPYWDDIWPNAFQDGDNIFWDVQGTAPNRELIIEYRNLTHFSLRGEDQRITFQVVLFENSSDVLFNYADTNFNDQRFSHGSQATIGLQVAESVAREYSVNSSGSIAGGQSLLWTLTDLADLDLGPDLVVSRAAEVSLDGSTVSSSPTLADIVSYQWSQVAGPAVTLSDADTPVATFIAPSDSAVMQFDLIVTDSNGDMAQGRIKVRTNTAPQAVADALDVLNFEEFGVLFSFNSFDPDGNISSYQWTQTSGTPVELDGADSTLVFFTAPDSPGILSFELTVQDSLGLSASDSVDVRVNDPPSADAGVDQTARKGNEVRLRASGMDSDGFAQFYQWRPISGPTVTLSGANTAIPSFTPDTAGTYQFQVQVFDNDGASDTDEVSITVINKKKKGGGVDWWVLILLLVMSGIVRRSPARL